MKYSTYLCLLVFLMSCYSKTPENTGLEGKPMPSFKLLLNDSITYIDTKDIPIGKPVVLFYFGPHCPHSHAQMEEIIEDMAALKNIQFYAFTTWPFAEMKSFYQKHQLAKYKNLTIGIDYTNFFADYFEAPGVPYIAIYGKDKKLRKAFIGKTYGKQIKNIAEQ